MTYVYEFTFTCLNCGRKKTFFQNVMTLLTAFPFLSNDFYIGVGYIRTHFTAANFNASKTKFNQPFASVSSAFNREKKILYAKSCFINFIHQ